MPLIIRGPGFDHGTHDDRLAANIDLAPTVLQAAGVRPGEPVDGRPLQEPRDEADRRAVLLEVFGRDQAFTGLRTRSYTYAEYESGDRELYDLSADPEELRNLAASRRYDDVRSGLARRLQELRDCAARSCG